jgi:hypothetical protein
MRKAQEREKELGVGRERENFVFVVLFCVECRGREERGKKELGKRKRTNFFVIFFLIFFSRTQKRHKHTGTIIINLCV